MAENGKETVLRLRNLSLGLEEGEECLTERAERALGCPVRGLRIVRRAVDARRKSDVHFVYTLEVSVRDPASALARCRDASPAPDDRYTVPVPASLPAERPVIVGFGPAGMFAGLVLALAGLRPIILERGEDAVTRAKKVAALRRLGVLDPESNIQFGEGGAGAFSDGKLSTGVKDPRIPWVLEQLAEAGAPKEILTDAKPHIGTDRLPEVCTGLRRRITALGGEVRFGQRLVEIEAERGQVTAAVTPSGRLSCESLLLACGHSARDTFALLERLGIPMRPKAFAMGLRIEHLQRDIDAAQYGPFAGHPALPPADYSLACRLPDGRRCYTFCMCPGGEVVPAASEAGGVCVNGASPYKRDYVNSNAALLAAVAPEDFPFAGVLGGIAWQRELEKKAFEAGGGGYVAPSQTVGAFLGRGGGPVEKSPLRPSYEPGVRNTELRAVLPPVIAGPVAAALPVFGRKLRGFDAPRAVLTGPETRSSCPVRVDRDDTLQSPGLRGLYPCGEGAGWAGGIMSAALDGMKCAEALLRNL